ncbi:MAG: hypothetical protein AAGJ83_15655, partial [Planctomycetota bacterium]
MSSLLQSMRAIELLSRGTPARKDAAEATLNLARRWGSETMGTGSPQAKFTSSIVELFYYYLPSPGIEVLSEELLQGNRRSKIVSTLIIVQYTSGVRPEEFFGRETESSSVQLARIARGSESDRDSFKRLVNSLRVIAEQAEDVSKDYAAKSLLQLARAYEDSQQIPEWLTIRFVATLTKDQETVDRLVAEADGNASLAMQNLLTGQHGGFVSLPDWTQRGELFPLAWKLYRQGRFAMSREYAVTMFGKRFAYDENWTGTARLLEEVLSEFEGAKILFMPFAMEIVRNFTVAGDPGFGGSGFGGLGLAYTIRQEPEMLVYLRKLIEILAADEESVELSLPIVGSFQTYLLQSNDPKLRESLLSDVDSAYRTLERRFNQSLFDSPEALLNQFEEVIHDRGNIVSILDSMTQECIEELAGYQLIELSLITACTEFAERPQDQFAGSGFDASKFPVQRGLVIDEFVKSQIHQPAGSDTLDALQKGVIWLMPSVLSNGYEETTFARPMTRQVAKLLKDPRDFIEKSAKFLR